MNSKEPKLVQRSLSELQILANALMKFFPIFIDFLRHAFWRPLIKPRVQPYLR